MYLRQLIFGNLLACCLLASSCGGGGGGIVGIDGSGSRVSSVSVTGPINGFGSVIVNGVHYNTDNAKIYIRGELADEKELNVGDYVVVVGHINENGEGTAYEVHYQPLVTGTIEWINKEQNKLSILGQTILLLDDTTLSKEIIPRNIEGLQVGQTVTVSGTSDANKVIHASRVELSKTLSLDFAGEIEAVNTPDNTYTVNGVKVDLSGVPIDVDPSEGDWIAVSGERFSNGVFHAYHLNKGMDYRKLEKIETIKLGGFVKFLSDDGRLFVDRVPVKITSSTTFISGTADDLDNNSNVIVEGSFDKNLILIANKLTFTPSPDTQVYGHIANVQQAPFGSYYLGTIEVQGNIFKIDFGTRLVGDNEERISFIDLKPWDTVVVSGFYKGDKYIATGVTVDNRIFDDNLVEMQGWVFFPMPDRQTFPIFNTIAKTDSDTQFSEGGKAITGEAFFSKLNGVGQLVQVRGHYEGYLLVATSVQLNPWFEGKPPPMPYFPPPPPK